MDFYDSKNEKEYSYEGSAGVPLNFFNRMLYACKYGDINLAISGYITRDSRILANRNVIERAKLAIPFLDYDEDAQIAVTGDGRLVWLVDAYTTTNYYPYSQRIYNIDKEFGTNYIRNSVKLVIDAYNGDVTAYVMDWNDPIIQSYNATYPGVFSSEPFPVDLAPQIKYPRKLFEIQANIYKRYHNTNPLTFYSKSDVWEVAKEKYGENSEMRLIEPYYSVMKDLKQEPQMMIMLPYTMADKDSNLTAWFAASSDIEDYGRLMTYMFPKGKHVYGTLQIENKIDNDPVIAKELTAMKNDTSTVMRGNMMVVPIMGTIVYVEPVYVTPQGRASLPEMKKVILVCGDSIVMENSLSAGFRRMLELKPESDYDSPISEITSPSSNIPTELSEKMSQAIAKYNEAKQFSKENDWVNYGRTMKEFEEQLAEVDKSLQEILPEPTDEATPAPEETAVPTPSASAGEQ